MGFQICNLSLIRFLFKADADRKGILYIWQAVAKLEMSVAHAVFVIYEVGLEVSNQLNNLTHLCYCKSFQGQKLTVKGKKKHS